MSDDNIFGAIAHPIRVQLVQLLAKHPQGFADLKRQLKIQSSGKLDFHLKKLHPLITTNHDNLYVLNDTGIAALQAINIIQKHGFQRRSYFFSLLVFIIMNVYSYVIIAPWHFLLWVYASLLPTTAWILFYTYTTFVKRRIPLRKVSPEEGQ